MRLNRSHDVEGDRTDAQQVKQRAKGWDSQCGPVQAASSWSGWPCHRDGAAAAAPACPAAVKREPSGGGSGIWSADPVAGQRNKEWHVNRRVEQQHFEILPSWNDLILTAQKK